MKAACQTIKISGYTVHVYKKINVDMQQIYHKHDSKHW